MVLLLAGIAAATCPAPTTTLDVERRLAKAEQAFADIDSAGLAAARDEARAALGCLGEAISPGVSARFHRMEALAALDADNRALAEQEFASARAVEPDYVLPSGVATETVVEIYRASNPNRGATQPLARPKEGALRLDGAEARVRPLERPTIFQLLGPRGEVLKTGYLLPGVPTPAYEAEDPRKRRSVRVGLLAGGAGGLAAAGALYAGALAVRTGPYADAVAGWEQRGSENDRARAEDLYETNHAMVVTSAVLGGLGMAVGVLGVTVRW